MFIFAELCINRVKESLLMRRNLILGVFSIVVLPCFVACSRASFAEDAVIGSDASYKIKQITELFYSYGWKLDTTINETERNQMILNMDYHKVKALLEETKNGIIFESSDSVKMRYCRRCID